MKRKVLFAITVAFSASTILMASLTYADVKPISGASATTDGAGDAADTSKSEASPTDGSYSQSVFDDGNIAFQITEVGHEEYLGYTWKVHLVNHTDKNMMFSIDNTAVNNVMEDPFWADEVKAGKEANDEIYWSDSSLQENGIEEVTKVEFELQISDSDDYSADPYLKQIFTVYPKGEDSVVDSTRIKQDTDFTLFDTDQVYMSINGVDPDGDMGYTLKATLINRTDKNLMFAIDDASVNGIMCDPYFATEVTAGNSSNCDISWSDSTLQENGITDVQSIELPIKVYDNDDWSAGSILEQSYTITP